MNRALWRKAVADAWRQLALSSTALIVLAWVFIWWMTFFKMGRFASLLRLLPGFVENMIGVSLDELATPEGRLSILYVHGITFLVCVGWAVGRGSDSISGEISRGTMDLILSLPVWRVTVIFVPAVIATFGAIVLPLSIWVGMFIGLQRFDIGQPASMAKLLPGAVNLCAMIFCFTGITTLISACNRDRWRTIVIAGGVFVASFLVEMISTVWKAGWWLRYFTFMAAYRPQKLVVSGSDGTALAWQYNLTLVGLGLAAYAVAAIIFWYRDIPAPR